MIALPSASISGLKPNGASSAGVARDGDEREVELVVGEEEAVGIEASSWASSGWPSMPSW